MITFTKEQLISRINQVTAINKYRISRDPAADGLAMDNELFAIALASLEAEPVGEVVLGEYDDCGCYPDARVVCIAADGQADWENFKDGARLYAAPPSMVVIDERAAFNAWNNDENLPIAGVGAKNAAWLAWQARAKLAAPPAPVSVPECFKRLLHHAYGMTMGHDWNKGTMAGHHRTKLCQAVEECRAAMLQGAENAESPTTMQAAPVLDSSPKIAESPSGNSPVIPDCSCRTCRPVTISDMRFVVCPDCGNKRCPHANDHRQACTGSNEPGQEGSAYPTAPQQEVK